MKDIIIIGSGPAGVSASLYTANAGIKTTVISNGIGALGKAEEIRNFYGTGGAIRGMELHLREIENAKSLGVEFINDEIVGLNWNEKYLISGKNAEYEADAVILATGSTRRSAKIKGLSEFEARGVSYCAVCDSFATRGKKAVIIGSGEYAMHEADALSGIAESITVIKNGQADGLENEAFISKGYNIIDKKISEICGNERVTHLILEDGETVECAMVFVALGVAGGVELARKVGAYIENGKAVIDENMSLGLPGLFSAGDCTGGLLQISKAVYEGTKAGLAAIKFIKEA